MRAESGSGIVSVLERKLAQRFREIDGETLSAVRSAWKNITPSPSCQPVGEVMAAIKTACADGIRVRSEEGIRIATETLTAYPSALSQDDIVFCKVKVRQLFPSDLYVTTAGNTAGVFQRQQAPKSKFSERRFELEMASVTADSANRTRSSVQKIYTCIDEIALRKVPIDSTVTHAPTVPSRGVWLRQFWYAHWQWLIGTLLLGVLGIVFS